MATEALKTMKEQLMNCVQGQLGDLAKVNTHELGEAIDMIKDLAEAIYYCTITDSMEKKENHRNICLYVKKLKYNRCLQFKSIPRYATCLLNTL